VAIGRSLWNRLSAPNDLAQDRTRAYFMRVETEPECPLFSPIERLAVVDRTNRSIFAALLEKLIAGRVSNYEFEKQLPRSNDRAIMRIYQDFVWHLYGDDREYVLGRDGAVTEEARKMAERAIMFLRSDLEYEWPDYPGHGGETRRQLLTCAGLGAISLAVAVLLVVRYGGLMRLCHGSAL
jgi:hypothetical protein